VIAAAVTAIDRLDAGGVEPVMDVGALFPCFMGEDL
jgi:hypothetical protein